MPLTSIINPANMIYNKIQDALHAELEKIRDQVIEEFSTKAAEEFKHRVQESVGRAALKVLDYYDVRYRDTGLVITVKIFEEKKDGNS